MGGDVSASLEDFMDESNLIGGFPKDRHFSLTPEHKEELSLLPTLSEVGADLEYKGVVRIGGLAVALS
jgi:hypothetical protein